MDEINPGSFSKNVPNLNDENLDTIIEELAKNGHLNDINGYNFDQYFKFDPKKALVNNDQEDLSNVTHSTELKQSPSAHTLVAENQPIQPDAIFDNIQQSESFLNSLSWPNFGLQSSKELIAFNNILNDPSVLNDSTTLNSESLRSSVDFFDTRSNSDSELAFNESPSSSNSYNSNLPNNVLDQNPKLPTSKKKLPTISNSISSIFRNPTQKFTFRGINPLSTNKDNEVLINKLPNLVEDVENLSLDQQQIGQSISNNPEEELSFLRRGKKSATNSIVNALNSARFSFNKPKNVNGKQGFNERDREMNEDDEFSGLIDLNQIPEDLEESHQLGSNQITIKVEDENGKGVHLDTFDDELNKVISMVSSNPSNFDFNRMLNEESTIPDGTKEFLKTSESSLKSSNTSAGSHFTNLKETDDSPNYAALFSNMNGKKRPSKAFSIGRLSLSQPKNTKDSTPLPIVTSPSAPDSPPLTNNFLSIDDSESISLRTPRSSITSLSEDITSSEGITISPYDQPTRGRKPAVEFDATKMFVCTLCSRRFRRQEHLKRHFRSLHTHEKPFNCPKCSKKFSRTDNLAQHIKTHDI
ncbi:hypothetical protein WICMUC_003326 [Wickerhamomyces mucosus]|uniref:C2H2-type domain-containing protein n=1 Tax=Wickerhamomyces mucosus TaxID=1378264 RepID=A0A9P8PLI5_9ASCO|nr:hypothetical protein WICMUC_003326 [Wickerhamomyces mucosus]